VSEQGSPSGSDLELFRSAIDAGRLGLWSWDLRSNRLTWSTNLEDFHGSPEGNPGGTLVIAPAELPSQDATGVLAATRKCLETREPYRLEYRVPAGPEDDERWFEASVTAIVEDGAAVQVLGMCRDVTERLRINREVRVRSRQQETLARLGERALTETDLQKFFDEVVTTVGEIIVSSW
jgi:PAS domain S-box-containing protein